jgi:hypothetical protein
LRVCKWKIIRLGLKVFNVFRDTKNKSQRSSLTE